MCWWLDVRFPAKVRPRGSWRRVDWSVWLGCWSLDVLFSLHDNLKSLLVIVFYISSDLSVHLATVARYSRQQTAMFSVVTLSINYHIFLNPLPPAFFCKSLNDYWTTCVFGYFFLVEQNRQPLVRQCASSVESSKATSSDGKLSIWLLTGN